MARHSAFGTAVSRIRAGARLPARALLATALLMGASCVAGIDEADNGGPSCPDDVCNNGNGDGVDGGAVECTAPCETPPESEDAGSDEPVFSGATQYDLYATDLYDRGEIPFEVNWPVAPTIAQTVQVTNDAELADALAIPESRIELAAGRYGALTQTQNDQHLVLHNDAIIAAGVSITGERVIIEGGRMEAGGAGTQVDPGENFVIHHTSDVLIMNMNILARGVLNGLGADGQNTRVAFVHNTIYSRRTGLYMTGVSPSGDKSTDIIYAANYVSGGMTTDRSGWESTFRVQGAERVIIVDNRARCGFDGQGIKHTFRSHYGTHNFFMRRNMNEYGDGIYFKPRANQETILPEDFMGDHWVYDHLNYFNGAPQLQSANAFRDSVSPTNWYGHLVAVNNTAYRAVQTDPAGQSVRFYWQGQEGDVVNENTEFPYEAPPALSSWLAADGLPPGADH